MVVQHLRLSSNRIAGLNAGQTDGGVISEEHRELGHESGNGCFSGSNGVTAAICSKVLHSSRI